MITVYESDNRFFVQSGSTVSEIDSGIIQEWDKDGLPINLIHMEGKD